MIQDPYKYLPLIMVAVLGFYLAFKLWYPIAYQFVHGEEYCKQEEKTD